MRAALFGCVLLFLGWGCSSRRPSAAGAPQSSPAPTVVVRTNTPPVTVTPTRANVGKVAHVNAAARFAVLSYPPGRVPPVDKRLGVWRDGLKVAELKVTGPQRDQNTVADIIAGEARTGDEVRDE